jgi:hypothetical protein
MVLSSDPEAISFESGLQANVEIPARCPSSVCSSFPVSAFQILMVPSAEQLAILLPSGENLTAETPFLCPLSMRLAL